MEKTKRMKHVISISLFPISDLKQSHIKKIKRTILLKRVAVEMFYDIYIHLIIILKQSHLHMFLIILIIK